MVYKRDDFKVEHINLKSFWHILNQTHKKQEWAWQPGLVLKLSLTSRGWIARHISLQLWLRTFLRFHNFFWPGKSQRTWLTLCPVPSPPVHVPRDASVNMFRLEHSSLHFPTVAAHGVTQKEFENAWVIKCDLCWVRKDVYMIICTQNTNR